MPVRTIVRAALVGVAGLVLGGLATAGLVHSGAHPAGSSTVRAAWPSSGQAAMTVAGRSVAGPSGGAVPIASVAKVMTAYVVLVHHPLGAHEDGPTITVTGDEAADSAARRGSGESFLGLTAGQQLTERQALEALLLPSANDVAMVLARWDSGGVDAFVAAENRAVAQLGMTRSRYTDPSGLLPTTVSTAADQVRLFDAAMRLPAFAAIAGEHEAVLPGAGTVRTTDTLLGRDGIVAGKTGSTAAAGGCFVFRAERVVNGRPVRVTGAVLGQPGRGTTALIASALSAAEVLVVGVGSSS